MKIAALILTSLVLAVQSPPPSPRQKLIASIETGTRAKFGEWMKEFWPKFESASDEDRRRGLRGIKFLYYNKAYNEFLCITANSSTTEAQVMQCIKDRNAQLLKFTKLADYHAVIDRRTMIECEMRTRLFEAELEFQPFDFLQGENIHLFDLEKMNECLIGAVR